MYERLLECFFLLMCFSLLSIFFRLKTAFDSEFTLPSFTCNPSLQRDSCWIDCFSCATIKLGMRHFTDFYQLEMIEKVLSTLISLVLNFSPPTLEFWDFRGVVEPSFQLYPSLLRTLAPEYLCQTHAHAHISSHFFQPQLSSFPPSPPSSLTIWPPLCFGLWNSQSVFRSRTVKTGKKDWKREKRLLKRKTQKSYYFFLRVIFSKTTSLFCCLNFEVVACVLVLLRKFIRKKIV